LNNNVSLSLNISSKAVHTLDLSLLLPFSIHLDFQNIYEKSSAKQNKF